MTVATKIKSHIPARKVGAINLTKVPSYQALEQIGIGLDERTVAKMIDGMGLDSSLQSTVTTANTPTPVQFLQNWIPSFAKVVTGARKIDEILGVTTMGAWHQEEVVQPILENLGLAVPYGDLTNTPFSSWNLTFERRSIVRFEEGMRVGNLEEARASEVRVNSAETKRESAALALEIQRNLVGFNGYNSGNDRTYGLLNDPNLPSYVNVAATGTGSSLTWASKTVTNITNDLRVAIAALRTQSKDVIDPAKTPVTLVLPTNAVDYLSTAGEYNKSVRDWLRENYPNIRIVSAPQLNTANGGAGVFYLFAENVEAAGSGDNSTFMQIVPSKFQIVGVAKHAKGYEESYSNATAGVMCRYPIAVVRYSGIS